MNGILSLARIIFLSLLVVMAIGCRREVVQPPIEPWPSRVVTSEGIMFEVFKLKIPGTKQDLKIKMGGTTTWIPLSEVANIRLWGPIVEQYRPARIFLLKGGRIEGELFVDFILEGTFNQAYWNVPMNQVVSLDMGSD
jgi:hypothetical protein